MILSARPPSRVLIVDADGARRSARASALLQRALVVDEADGVVDALRLLPSLAPDLILVAVDPSVDVETLARGVHSLHAVEHCQVLAVGDGRPVSPALQATVSSLPESTPLDVLAREAEKLAHRAARRKKP